MTKSPEKLQKWSIKGPDFAKMSGILPLWVAGTSGPESEILHPRAQCQKAGLWEGTHLENTNAPCIFMALVRVSEKSSPSNRDSTSTRHCICELCPRESSHPRLSSQGWHCPWKGSNWGACNFTWAKIFMDYYLSRTRPMAGRPKQAALTLVNIRAFGKEKLHQAVPGCTRLY